MTAPTPTDRGLAIAIVGMACRAPGARNIRELWRNLHDGVESIVTFTDAELRAFGVDPARLGRLDFVKAGAILADADAFDARFFGYAPAEARLLDPQHRVFLECAWEALEDAGYAPPIAGVTAVYAGASMSSHLLYRLWDQGRALDPDHSFAAMVANDKDFLSTRVCYELGLQGPGLTVQSGCSTSLVAIHLACLGLLTYQCDLALAGGVSIQVPERTGHLYQEGGICSPDGHCRAFDARAQGTIFGSGAGAIVLKRAGEAFADGDHVYALILGSAINNDGSRKVGFTAPSVQGQADVIRAAQAVAGVDPASIEYVEAHGTGTALGDPVEIAALKEAFGPTVRAGFCGVGSIKSNIGHLDAAAGVVGTIKTALALHHRLLPPTLHVETPNAYLALDQSPFYINGRRRDWPPGETPRRAGVSSFGIGGTNAHAVLEEAPVRTPAPSAQPYQVLTLSAKGPEALERATQRIAAHLAADAEADDETASIADVAYTLQVGRAPFAYRRAIVCRSAADAVAILADEASSRVVTDTAPDARSVTFMFPGGGAQHAGMAAGLYETMPVFREPFDAVRDLIWAEAGFDLRVLLFKPRTEAEAEAQAASLLTQTETGLCALFAVEYALAQVWRAWGVSPRALIGHSLGEYVAACLAGVFSLRDAVRLVVRRGRLFGTLPRGAMLSVSLPPADLARWLEADADVSVAAINGADHFVLAGRVDAIDRLSASLQAAGLHARRLPIEVAAHSPLVDAILDDFARTVQTLDLRAPTLPVMSNVTGTWLTDEEAMSPAYWVRHLRQTVRFGDGLAELAKVQGQVLLEVGPGQTLTTLARRAHGQGLTAVPSMRHPLTPDPDEATLMGAVARLWVSGVAIDWRAWHGPEDRARVSLPTYPFERQVFSVDPVPRAARAPEDEEAAKRADVSTWFSVPSWRRAAAHAARRADAAEAARETWLIFADRHGVGAALAGALREAGQRVCTVEAGQRFRRQDETRYELRVAAPADYAQLWDALAADEASPDRIVHLWSVQRGDVADPDRAGAVATARLLDAGFYSLIHLAQAIGGAPGGQPIRLHVISDGLHRIERADEPVPAQATVLGPCKVIPQELDGVTVSSVEIALPAGGAPDAALVASILSELQAESMEPVCALRGAHRWVPHEEPVALSAPTASPIREQGVYLILGGLGSVGARLAADLAESARCHLVLTGRVRLPAKAEWDAWLRDHAEDDAVSRRVRQLQQLEARAASVWYEDVDVADEAAMRGLLARIEQTVGRLDGVIACMGDGGVGSVKLIAEIDREECERQLRAKVHGLDVLQRVLDGRALDFCLLMSSTTSLLGGIGSVAYTAANLFTDAIASACDARGLPWLSANWDGWPAPPEQRAQAVSATIATYAMTESEALDAWRRAVGSHRRGQLIVSTGALAPRKRLWITDAGRPRRRPGADSADRAPRLTRGSDRALALASTPVEQTLAEIWQEQLGVDRLGVHENFFELGGSSLIGLKVIAAVKARLGVSLPIISLFERPTVITLAALIATDAAAEPPQYTASQQRGAARRARQARRRPATV